MIDTYYSRRGKFNLCQYWERDEEGVGNSEEYTYYNIPTGCFYAEQVNSENIQLQMIDAFMADEHHIMISTNDYVPGMHPNCLVKWDGQIWRVENAQPKIRKKQSEYSPRFDYQWFIELRR